jgi:small subunit ribosomal protein S16
VIVQDDRFSPKSGRVVAYVGSYDPHTKVAKLDDEKIGQYLGNGAQPSDRVAGLLKKGGIKLPNWVKVSEPQKRAIKHPEKLRRNRPAGEAAPEPVPAPVAELITETQETTEPVAPEQPGASAAEPEAPAEEAPAVEETPAEEPAAKTHEAEPKPEETA